MLDYPEQATAVMLNLLGSHDTARPMTVAKGDVATLQLMTAMQFTFEGAPCIYYGDEIGLEGGKDPDCRRCYPWNKPSNTLKPKASKTVTYCCDYGPSKTFERRASCASRRSSTKDIEFHALQIRRARARGGEAFRTESRRARHPARRSPATSGPQIPSKGVSFGSLLAISSSSIFWRPSSVRHDRNR